MGAIPQELERGEGAIISWIGRTHPRENTVITGRFINWISHYLDIAMQILFFFFK